jgi:drug/metabolite transporter (DMT)-like permease
MLSVLYQGVIIGAFCFTIWIWLIRRHAASRVAVFGFIAPLVGVLLGAFALHEPISAALVVSAALVALGIVFANLW